MSVLFFNGFNVSPHLETEMEIAKKLLLEGRDVYFVHCRGELQTCFGNPSHVKWICANCRDRKAKALKMIGLPDSKVLTFPQDVVVDEAAIPAVFESMDALRLFYYKGVDIGMGVASSLVSAVREHRLDTLLYKDDIRRAIWTAIYAYECSVRILDDVKPEEAYLFNGRFLEIRPFMRACEQKGIPYYTHERGGSIHTYITRANSTPHSLEATKAEILSAWELGGDEKREIGKKFFVDRRNKVVQSWVVFTENQENGKLPVGFDPGKKNIAIFNSSMDEYEGIAGFTDKIYKDDNQGIIEVLEHFRAEKSMHFYLRVHPNLKGLDNTQTKTLEQIRTSFPNVTVIGPGEVIDSYALMEAVDIVAVFSSTMGAEAAFWGRPTVLLGNAFYGGLEGCYKPASHQEVVQLLSGDLTPLPAEDILKYGYWEMTKGTPYAYYKPENLATGTFLGRKVDIPVFRKAINRLLN